MELQKSEDVVIIWPAQVKIQVKKIARLSYIGVIIQAPDL